ncbi:MAG: hypothetical protein SO168_06220 [Muribaculaceae bacterium]|nr:hypothetical protein [Muribaculaceae bacterium]
MKLKNSILLLSAMACTGTAAAQQEETFDNNSWQWTESMSDAGKVYIVDGVMRLETNTPTSITYEQVADLVSTHAYLPMDPTAGFTITCDAKVAKIADDKYFGILLDYMDNMNFMCFTMSSNWAYLYKITEGKVTRKWKGQLHLPKQKKAVLDIKITYAGGDLEIRVDDIQAIHAKYAPIESNGFGFFAYGKTKIDFDNVKITY